MKENTGTMGVKVGHKKERRETCIHSDQKDFKIITKNSGHYPIALETLKKERRRSCIWKTGKKI